MDVHVIVIAPDVIVGLQVCSLYPAIVGLVSTLLDNVSLPSSVANVPANGNVTPVVPETVSVVAYAPLTVMVDAALLATPVPP